MALSFTLKQLSFTYPNRPGEPALVDLSLTLPDSGVVALLGPSGSGKTTLLHLLGLLWERSVPPGQLFYGERDCARLSRREYNELRLHQFGYVLQSCYMLPHFTCRDNLTLPLFLRGWDDRRCRDRVDLLLRRLEPEDGPGEEDKEKLGQVLDSLGSEVSVGQRQRMAVFRAVIHDPYVVFADEPVSNLDPRNTDKMVRLLTTWQQGGLALPDQPADYPRLLVLVCHHLRTAQVKARASWFVVLGTDHRKVCSIPASEWPTWEEKVLDVLGAD
jgi:ABC-type lipoprotein export system ATPase subunit